LTKRHAGEKKFWNINFKDSEFVAIVENAIQYELTVLLEGIDEFYLIHAKEFCLSLLLSDR
jgi:hypothetical protein